MAKNKSEILADLIKEKTAAGLSPVQARECAERQLAHDEQLEAAEAEAETKSSKKSGGGKSADLKPEGDAAKK